MTGAGLTEQQLKESKIEQVFYFYDEPVLYTCFIDKLRYLVSLVDLSNDRHVYFYTLLNNDSYNQLLENRIDLFSAFKLSKTGSIYKVIVDKNNKHSSAVVEVGNILETDLPAQGIYLFEETRGNTANN